MGRLDLMRFTVAFNWGISSFFGWGIYGLNLALHWVRDPNVRPICSVEVNPARIEIDALRRRLVDGVLKSSAPLIADLARAPAQVVVTDLNVMTALGNSFATAPSAHNTQLKGATNIGVAVLEDTRIDAATRERARRYDLLVAGSTWNRALLADNGLEPVSTVLQGVDPTLFHPAPRSELFRDRFVVFSGGKIEFRKGQDLVLLAFRAFAERHPEALLVTAWHAPWSAVAQYPFSNERVPAVPLDAHGRPDIAAWVAANGIAPQNFVDLGAVSNDRMAPLYREADVALFPNRCEAGTNLVAMECMACGVPAILAANTGHLDLIEGENCYALGRQSQVAPRENLGTEGWGESDSEEILACLEQAWRDRADARERGARGAERLARLSWAATASNLKQTILPYLKPPLVAP